MSATAKEPAMQNPAPQKIFLSDYTPPAYLVASVELVFKLSGGATRVISKIAFKPNPAATSRDFFLHGEFMTLEWARIDGTPVAPDVTGAGLTCTVPDAPFLWECEVEIAPQNNTALEGLYMSGGMYCTQCEAEGFRRITYYPDRPDVMSVFTVRIEGDLPVMLSNGNMTGSGPGWVEWHDPWPKPAYLFALVAGDLRNHPGSFTTMSGRNVKLNIWVRPDDIDKCAFAMDALKLSMKWDEQVYGREYDLDLFNIVAVDDFNMGAMENKGLNIFNSSCVLASPETATDANFERIEGIIAHEYFHNWTGNRITCRDWFQLCLKEGLTVFRDQSFTADMRGAAVKRIDDVATLRARQFREDQGPLAHPVRPDSFVEINNFYTATIYEKGAEVIRMLKTLVGDDAYRQALDLYFTRHDGDAATIEDWLKVFEDTTGRDLTAFSRWYSQAGTPRLKMRDRFENGTYTLDFEQHTPATPGQDRKQPQVIPIAVGLLGADGAEILPTTILEMTGTRQSFDFPGLSGRPVPSVLRGFSAPVVLERRVDSAERLFLMTHDTDSFNKREAAFELGREVLAQMALDGTPPPAEYLDAMARVAQDTGLAPGYRAALLQHSSQDDLAQHLFETGHTPDPARIYDAVRDWKQAMAQNPAIDWAALCHDCTVDGPYSPDAQPAGKRALGLTALSFLARLDNGDQARARYAAADNMTLQLSALGILLGIGAGDAEQQAFFDQWSDDRLVLDKWFGIRVLQAAPDRAAAIARSLAGHPAFDMKNPNRFRAVFGALSMHHAGFHHASGDAYRLLADRLIGLDAINPQTTARMSAAFQAWRRYDPARQTLVKTELRRILATPDLSGDTREMVSRIAGD
jgi:aminopeptidase N